MEEHRRDTNLRLDGGSDGIASSFERIAGLLGVRLLRVRLESEVQRRDVTSRDSPTNLRRSRSLVCKTLTRIVRHVVESVGKDSGYRAFEL